MTNSLKVTRKDKVIQKCGSAIKESMSIGSSYISVGRKVPNADKLKEITIVNGRYKKAFRKAV